MKLDPTLSLAFLSFLGTLAIGAGTYLNNRSTARTAAATAQTAAADSADKRENNLIDQLQEQVASLRARVTELERDREDDREHINDLYAQIWAGEPPPPRPRPRRGVTP